jgi:hypothetical protein
MGTVASRHGPCRGRNRKLHAVTERPTASSAVPVGLNGPAIGSSLSVATTASTRTISALRRARRNQSRTVVADTPICWLSAGIRALRQPLEALQRPFRRCNNAAGTTDLAQTPRTCAATRAAPAPVWSMRFADPVSDPYTSGTGIAPSAKPTVATFVRTRQKAGGQRASLWTQVSSPSHRVTFCHSNRISGTSHRRNNPNNGGPDDFRGAVVLRWVPRNSPGVVQL